MAEKRALEPTRYLPLFAFRRAGNVPASVDGAILAARQRGHVRPAVRARSTRQTGMCLITLPASAPVRMEEDEWIIIQPPCDHGYHVAGPNQACVAVPHWTFRLEARVAYPPVGESEAFTTVIVLAVFDPLWLPIDKHGRAFESAIAYTCNQFGEVQSRIGIVVDTQQEHAAVQFVDTTNRTLRLVRRQRERISEYFGRVWSERGECVGVLAPQNAARLPEISGHDAKIRRRPGSLRVERHIVDVGP